MSDNFQIYSTDFKILGILNTRTFTSNVWFQLGSAYWFLVGRQWSCVCLIFCSQLLLYAENMFFHLTQLAEDRDNCVGVSVMRHIDNFKIFIFNSTFNYEMA